MHDEPRSHDETDEIVITIEPRMEMLESIGSTLEEFDEAVNRTLDAYDQTLESAAGPDDVLPLEDAEIQLAGRSFPLSAVADICVSDGDLDELDEPDDLD